jgi:hypothetical protein
MLKHVMKTRLVPGWVASAALLLASGPSWAQQPAKGTPAAAPARPAQAAPARAAQKPPAGNPPPAAGTGTTMQDPKVTVERGAGGKKVYRITDALRIEGKIQKPEAFYVLQKSSINYDWQDLKQDFVPKIFESVAQAPF